MLAYYDLEMTMRILWTCVLLLISTVSAAAVPRQVWSCEGINSTGFKWENDNWETFNFFPTNYLLTIGEGGTAATLLFDGHQWSFSDCVHSNVALCTSRVGNTLILNLATGQGAVSSIVATALPPDGDIASSFIERIQYTKV